MNQNPMWAATLALAIAAGCASSSPRDVFEEEEIRSLQAELAGAVAFKTAVHLAAGRAGDSSRDGGGWPVALDLEDLGRDLHGTIRKFGVFKEIVALDALGPEADEEQILQAARNGEADLVLLLRPVKTEVRYVGRDILLWGIDLLLWTFLWVPAYFIPDKEFASEMSLELRILDAASGREIYARTYRGEASDVFDDFSKGFGFLDIWSPLLAQWTIGESNGQTVARVLMPHALFQVKRELLRDLGVDFQAALQTPEIRNRITPKGRRFFAVAVGADSPPGPRRVGAAFAKADAQAFWSALGKFSSPAIDSEGSRLLVGADASAGSVLDALNALKNRFPRPDEDVLFYFSGLGAVGKGAAGPEPVLVTSGADPKDIERTGLPLSTLLAKLAELGAGRVTVIIDAGFGRKARARSLGASARAGGEAVYPKAPAALAKEGTILLAGQAGSPVMEVAELGHGLLTSCLLEALDGSCDANSDGKVTLGELAAHLRDRLPAMSETVGTAQTPWTLVGNPEREMITPEPGKARLPADKGAGTKEGAGGQ